MGGTGNEPAHGRRDGTPKELEAVRTTIVGGRPPGRGRDWGEIPRGIEVLVKKASIDPAFKLLLLEQRAKAATEIDLALDPAEMAILEHAPRAQLEAIIARTHVDRESRAAFLGRAAAVMLAALGAGPLAAAGEKKPSKTDGAQPKDSKGSDTPSEKPKKKPTKKQTEKPADKDSGGTAAKSSGAKEDKKQATPAKKKKRPTARESAPKNLTRSSEPQQTRGIQPLGIRPCAVRRWRHYK